MLGWQRRCCRQLLSRVPDHQARAPERRQLPRRPLQARRQRFLSRSSALFLQFNFPIYLGSCFSCAPSYPNSAVDDDTADIEDGKTDLEENKRISLIMPGPDNPKKVTEQEKPETFVPLPCAFRRNHPRGHEGYRHRRPLNEVHPIHSDYCVIDLKRFIPAASLRSVMLCSERQRGFRGVDSKRFDSVPLVAGSLGECFVVN